MVLESGCRVGFLRTKVLVQGFRGRGSIRHGPLGHRPVVVNLCIFLNRDLLWLGHEPFAYPRVLLGHSVLVQAFFQEHLLLSQGISVDDDVVLRALS